MTDPDQPHDSAVIQISKYLQQLIVLDMLGRAIEAQEKGKDCLPLLKSLRDYVESQGKHEKAEWCLIAELSELCSLAARADQQRSEPCADDSVLDGQ